MQQWLFYDAAVSSTPPSYQTQHYQETHLETLCAQSLRSVTQADLLTSFSSQIYDTDPGRYPNNYTNNKGQNSENSNNTRWVGNLPLKEHSNHDTKRDKCKEGQEGQVTNKE